MIANDLDDAAAMKSRAEEAGTAYEAALAAAKGRAQALAQETRAKLSTESDANRKALEADLNQRLADAEATITSKKAEAMSHVDAIARDTASAIIERLTGKAPAPQKVEAALNQIKA
jgi:F-type H+-transporting ATPase subunit b